jgi:transposase-like protein
VAVTANLRPPGRLPDWVPPAVRVYLDHTAGGASLRAIARREGVHASTVMRQVRRFESRRDDPLIDTALGRLHPSERPPAPDDALKAAVPIPEEKPMSFRFRPDADAATPLPGEGALLAEARRLLPLLAAPDTVLAVAPDMPRAVVVREGPDGGQRLAALERAVAEAFALRDWIDCRKQGRVSLYALTAEGRGMLRKLGLAPARLRPMPMPEDEGDARFRPAPESPIAILARRRDTEGRPFLPPEMVAAAERLREDFEISRIEPRGGTDWTRVLTGGVRGSGRGGGVPGATPAAARARLEAALAELGPGLGDVALRCCCWQEGVETAEQKLGWSARSGKIVLRIALERLARHYAAQGEAGKMVG